MTDTKGYLEQFGVNDPQLCDPWNGGGDDNPEAKLDVLFRTQSQRKGKTRTKSKEKQQAGYTLVLSGFPSDGQNDSFLNENSEVFTDTYESRTASSTPAIGPGTPNHALGFEAPISGPTKPRAVELVRARGTTMTAVQQQENARHITENRLTERTQMMHKHKRSSSRNRGSFTETGHDIENTVPSKVEKRFGRSKLKSVESTHKEKSKSKQSRSQSVDTKLRRPSTVPVDDKKHGEGHKLWKKTRSKNKEKHENMADIVEKILKETMGPPAGSDRNKREKSKSSATKERISDKENVAMSVDMPSDMKNNYNVILATQEALMYDAQNIAKGFNRGNVVRNSKVPAEVSQVYLTPGACEEQSSTIPRCMSPSDKLRVGVTPETNGKTLPGASNVQLTNVESDAKRTYNQSDVKKTSHNNQKSRATKPPTKPDIVKENTLPRGLEDEGLLLKASRNGELDKMEEELTRLGSAAVGLRDSKGNTAMHICAETGNLKGVSLLYSNFPQMLLEVNKFKMSPAGLAIQFGKTQILEWLLQHGRSQLENQLKIPHKRPLMHQAARHGQDQCLFLLLNTFHDILATEDLRDMHGNTPAHMAAKYGHQSCLQTLVEYGMDVSSANNYGYSPCYYADFGNHRHCARYLMVVEVCLHLALQLILARYKDTTDILQTIAPEEADKLPNKDDLYACAIIEARKLLRCHFMEALGHLVVIRAQQHTSNCFPTYHSDSDHYSDSTEGQHSARSLVHQLACDHCSDLGDSKHSPRYLQSQYNNGSSSDGLSTLYSKHKCHIKKSKELNSEISRVKKELEDTTGLIENQPVDKSDVVKNFDLADTARMVQNDLADSARMVKDDLADTARMIKDNDDAGNSASKNPFASPMLISDSMVRSGDESGNGNADEDINDDLTPTPNKNKPVLSPILPSEYANLSPSWGEYYSTLTAHKQHMGVRAKQPMPVHNLDQSQNERTPTNSISNVDTCDDTTIWDAHAHPAPNPVDEDIWQEGAPPMPHQGLVPNIQMKDEDAESAISSMQDMIETFGYRDVFDPHEQSCWMDILPPPGEVSQSKLQETTELNAKILQQILYLHEKGNISQCKQKTGGRIRTPEKIYMSKGDFCETYNIRPPGAAHPAGASHPDAVHHTESVNPYGLIHQAGLTHQDLQQYRGEEV